MKTTRDVSLIGLLAAALTARVIVALSPMAFLMRQVVPDDAFYYFTIAGNIVHGNGLTFDGLAPTNGYHPLWMALLLPVFALVRDPYASIHVVLLLCAAIDTASIFLLYRVLGDINIRQWLRMVTCVLYAFSPFVFMSILGPMNALETSINTLILMLCFRMYLAMRDVSPMSVGAACVYGSVSGLAFLARTDNVIFLAILWAFLVAKHRKNRQECGRLLMGGVAALVFVGPWLIYSLTTFGSIVQISGRSVALMARESFAASGAGAGDYVMQFGRNLADMVKHLGGFRFPRTSVETGLTLGCIGVFVAGAASILWKRGTSFSLRKPFPGNNHTSVWLPIVLAYTLFVAVHTWRAVSMRPWYYYSFVMLMLVATSVLVQHLSTFFQGTASGGRRLFVSLMILVLGLQTVGGLRLIADHGGMVNEWKKHAVVQELNAQIPRGVTVGAWNAGVFGYFYEGGRVVNLDGSVNNAVFPSIGDHSLGRYARSVSVQYVVDDTTTLRNWSLFWRPDGLGMYGDLVPVDTLYDLVIARVAKQHY